MNADDTRPIRVLHVEDDPGFAEVASAMLDREHPAIEVETAEDAEACLAALAESAVDCVVSDFDMPGRDGLELLEAVRERHGDLPFVLFTGKGSEDIASEAISAGVTDYIQKASGREQYAMLANRIENAVERHRTEAALAEERRRFELVGRASADAFWDWDLETGEVERSEGYERIYGFDADEVGDDIDWWVEQVHPEDREKVRRAAEDAIDNGDDTFEVAYRVETAGGTYKDAYTRAHVVRDDGEAYRVVGAVTDVTGLRERERELEAVRTKLELVLEGTDTGVWEWDPATGEVTWDGTVERLFGLSPGSFEGTIEAVRRRIHEADREEFERAVDRALAGEDAHDEEFRIRRDDGGVRWVRSKGIVREPTGAESERFVGLVADVTERKVDEHEFEQYETIIQTVPDGILVVDEDGVIAGGNETAADMFGFEHGDLVGSRLAEPIEAGVVDASIVDRYADAVWRLLSSESDDEEARFEFEATADGDERVFEARIALRPFDDEYRGTIGVVRDVTERKEREREFEQYETILETLPDGVFLVDEEARILGGNTMASEMLGFSRDELIGTRFEELIEAGVVDPVVVDRYLDGVRQLLSSAGDEEVAGFEFEAEVAGEPRVFEARVALRPFDDEFRGTIGVIQDVTRRTEREDRLRRSERRFEAVFDDPSAFIGLLEPDGTLALANETALSFVGASLADVAGRRFVDTPWWDDETPRKRAEIERAIERAAEGEFVRFEASHTGVGGRTIDVEGHIRPVTDDSGEVVSLLVEGIDVTDRIEHERRIECLHETTREIVRADDADEVAAVVVRAAADVLDLPITVVRLRRGDELQPVAVSERAREVLGERPVYSIDEGMPGRTLQRGEPVAVDSSEDVDEDRYPWGDHSSLYVPIGDYGTLSVGTDRPRTFDDSHVALAQLLTDNAAVALDRLEGERTLRRRERALTRQNERLDRFASIVSHDLRNPITVAKGHLELVDGGADDEHVEKVESAIGRIEEIVDDVLSLARGGDGTVDPDPTDLGGAVADAWETIDASGATLDVAGDLGTCPADASRLRQLLENLFRNAAEHGGDAVTVRVGRLDGEDGKNGQNREPAIDGDSSAGDAPVRGFYVEDDGPGIPESERDRVFEFGRSGNGDGTGYGLAIVEDIADAHGWEVVATEAESGGARFEVTGV